MTDLRTGDFVAVVGVDGKDFRYGVVHTAGVTCVGSPVEHCCVAMGPDLSRVYVPQAERVVFVSTKGWVELNWARNAGRAGV